MDFPTIMVHTRKCYKAVIDSGTPILLIRYTTYQLIGDSFKTPIQPTTTKLDTADGSPITVLGMTVLHLRIADFKFTHNFIICDRLRDTEIIFGIDLQRKFSLSYAWDKEKNCYQQRDGRFITYTINCEQKATVGIVKSTLKYHLDTMVCYQLRSKAIQSQDIWHTSSLIKILQKEEILTLTSLTVFTTSKAKHVSIFYFQITLTNTSCLIKMSILDSWSQF